MKNWTIENTETKVFQGRTLHRVVLTQDCTFGKAGDKMGWIEKESNLQGNAMVYGNAKVYGNANVCGNARVCGDVEVCGNAMVYGNANVYGNAMVCNDAKVHCIKDYIVFKNWWSSGRYFTYLRSEDKYVVGCFYGTGKELIEKAYKDSKLSGDNYKRIVEYVESIKESLNTN